MNLQRIKMTSIRRIKREQGVFCTTFSSFREIFQLPFAAPTFWLHRNRKLILRMNPPSPKKKIKYMVVLHCRIIVSCTSWFLFSLLALAHLYWALNSSSESKRWPLTLIFILKVRIKSLRAKFSKQSMWKANILLGVTKMCAMSN